MYEAYFNLQKRPFSATPDASCFFAPDATQELLDQLVLRAERGEGISVVTGAAGTGKTLLCRRVSAELAARMTPIFLATANFPTRRALLQSVLFELGRKYSGLEEQELRLAVFGLLRELTMTGRGAVLIVDEAHLLSDRLLEELRLLVCLAEEDQPLARVILAGQPALEERLISPRLEALNQRITCHLYLEPLTKTESIDYIRYRVAWAGGDASCLFADDALESIAAASAGLPRCLNQLCDHTLLLTFVQEQQRVTNEIVAEALLDLRQLPLHWNAPIAIDHPLSGLESLGNEVESEYDGEEEMDIHGVSSHADGEAFDPVPCGDTVCFEIGGEDSSDAVSMDFAESISLADDHRATMIHAPEAVRSSAGQASDAAAERSALDADRHPQAGGPLDLAVEPLVDRYARLDAVMPRLQRTFEDAPVPMNWVPVACSDVPPAPEPHEANAESADEQEVYPIASGEDLRIERLPIATVSAAVEYDAVEPLHDESAEMVAEPTPADPGDFEPQLVEFGGVEPAGIEDDLRINILDVCREVQATLGSWREEEIPTASAAEQRSLDEMLEDVVLPEFDRELDVVEPDAALDRKTTREPAHGHRTLETPSAGRHVPKPKYRMIFSTLRRRLGRNR